MKMFIKLVYIYIYIYIYMNYDFLQPQLFRLLTQCFDCHRQPSSGILGRQVLPLLASCLSKQAVPYVTQSCKSCNHTYIGETGRTFGTRLEEHKKEVENITTRRFTREQKRVSTVIEHKSAITDHADRNNSIIDWEGAEVIDRECNRNARWIKEAIWIRKTTPVMNRDEGGYGLSHVWDGLLTKTTGEQRKNLPSQKS